MAQYQLEPQLYVIPLGEQMNSAEKEGLLAYIPASKRERLPKFRQWQDAQRTLLGYSLLNYLLAKVTGERREKIELTFDYYGKPHLAGTNTATNSGLSFNLSHSGDFIVCVVSPTIVGVDIEKIQSIDLAIADHFFSPTEARDLRTLPAEHQIDYFFCLWSLKESYIKAEGLGVSIPLSSFSFKVTSDATISFTTERPGPEYIFKLYNFPYDYKLAVCAEAGGLPENFRFISREELY